jgi:hypothetical protein
MLASPFAEVVPAGGGSVVVPGSTEGGGVAPEDAAGVWAPVAGDAEADGDDAPAFPCCPPVPMR